MNQQHNKRRRKKKSVNFPTVMFLGLLITCVAVIAAGQRQRYHLGN